MEITAKIIKDSINPAGERITTFIVKYPYWIHGEVMTHRMFSRNFPSTRAIPSKTYIAKVLNEMSIPEIWTKNEKGMSTDKLVDETLFPMLHDLWGNQGKNATNMVFLLESLGLHKQVANRLLMPFMMMEGIITATSFGNFFNLRDHPMAEPHIQILAREMKKAYNESIPNQLNWGDWHIPFDENYVLSTDLSLKEHLIKSVAACARVSYYNVDGSNSTPEKDLDLFNKLKDANPIHASPFEHCAKAFDWKGEIEFAVRHWNKNNEIDNIYKSQANFRGFQQLRWFIENNLPY